jgi:hypothetical protein
MKLKTLLTAVFSFLAVSRALFAFEIGSEFWLDSMTFSSEREPADSRFIGGRYPWGVSLSASEHITDNIRIEGGYSSDPILRNRVYSLLSYSEKIFTVGVGPFFGVFNGGSSFLKPGISSYVRLELPGVVFITLMSDSTVGGELLREGDYFQERGNVAIGFYVPNAICTLSLDLKKFNQEKDSYRASDSLTRYSFRTDVFQKNVPYRVGITFSYQSLSKTFLYPDSSTDEDAVEMIVVGADVNFNATKTLTLYAGFEASVYDFGQGRLSGETSDYFLFNFSTGFRLRLDSAAPKALPQITP